MEETETLDTSVIVSDIRRCDLVGPGDFAFSEEMGEEVDVEAIEGNDAMSRPYTVRAPSEVNPAA